MKNNNLTKLNKQDIIFKANLKGYSFEFYTTWGLFSPKAIDEGSSLLIDQLNPNKDDINLDIGCGYGAIGLLLARLAPNGITHLVDKDFVAIEYAKKNAEVNRLENCEIYLSNAFSHVPNIKFNNIVSNLPAHAGNMFLNSIIYEARKRLAKDGRLYVVTVSRLKEFIKRSFKEVFGNYKKLKQGKEHTVAVATRN